MNQSSRDNAAPLLRGLGLPLVVFYGVGTILGAGIYVLIGEVAGYAGIHAPVAFMTASLLAALTAFSYAELAVRFPRSAGEAIYVQEAFHRDTLAIVVGLMLVMIGITSSATLVSGLTGYVGELVPLPDTFTKLAAIGIFGAVVIWGIRQSVVIISLLTVIEILGLLIVIWVARDALGTVPDRVGDFVPGVDAAAWSGVLLGALVAFYAFIGFEDMVNVVEEIKSPEKNLPRGIIIALAITTLLYFVVALAAVTAVPPAELAASDAPLALIYETRTGRDPGIIALISILSITNGILVQCIMASRVLYGMSRRGWLPPVLGRIHPRTRTPVYSTSLVIAGICLMALTLPLLSLAKLTSYITLTVFALINLALVRIKLRGDKSPGFSTPLWVPVFGAVCTLMFLTYQLALAL
jgi:amino acid transporter